MTAVLFLLARARSLAPYWRLLGVAALMVLSGACAWHTRGVAADAARLRQAEAWHQAEVRLAAEAAFRDAANERAAAALRADNMNLLRRVRDHENDPDRRAAVPCSLLADLNRAAGAAPPGCAGQPHPGVPAAGAVPGRRDPRPAGQRGGGELRPVPRVPGAAPGAGGLGQAVSPDTDNEAIRP